MAGIRSSDLEAAIREALTQYTDRVGEATVKAITVATKQGVKAVRSNALGTFGGTGRYARGWTSKVETGRLSVQGVIYNKDLPGLPHLLEHGHAKRGGGRVAGRVHIAPVQDALEKAVLSELEGTL